MPDSSSEQEQPSSGSSSENEERPASLSEWLKRIDDGVQQDRLHRGKGHDVARAVVGDIYAGFMAAMQPENVNEFLGLAHRCGVMFGPDTFTCAGFIKVTCRKSVQGPDGKLKSVPDRSFEKYSSVVRFCVEREVNPRDFASVVAETKSLDAMIKADVRAHPRKQRNTASNPIVKLAAPDFLQGEEGPLRLEFECEVKGGQLLVMRVAADAKGQHNLLKVQRALGGTDGAAQTAH